LLLFLFLFRGRLLCFLFSFFSLSNLLLGYCLWLWELLILNFVLLNVLFLRVKLESNDGLDFSNLLLD
jgi:hypothetical protein